MSWFREHTGTTLAIVSVVLSAAVGIVSNILVDSWGWALLTGLLVLVSCLAVVEVIRHRADRTAVSAGSATALVPDRSHPPGSIVVTGSSVRGNIAGGDINQTKIGTGGFAAVIVVAAALGGGATYLGRTEAAIPQRAQDTTAATPAASLPTSSGTQGTGAEASAAAAAYRSSKTVLTGTDLDPPASTGGTVDVSFNSKSGKGGLSLLNGTALAVIPGDGRPTEATCRSAGGYSDALVAMPIAPGLSRCLRTSDGRYGTLSITSAETSALGGFATISWTVW